jgi:hypothetical protein
MKVSEIYPVAANRKRRRGSLFLGRRLLRFLSLEAMRLPFSLNLSS